MIRKVPGNFISGDVMVYIPRIGGGFHPVIITDKYMHICNNVFRERVITSVKIDGDVLSWEFYGSTENKDETYHPKKPIINQFGHGTIILLVSGDNSNYIIGFKLPSSYQLTNLNGKHSIEEKFKVETPCDYIIGLTPSSSPHYPDITLQDESLLLINHHSADDGRLTSEQKFKQETLFPSRVRCSKRQIGFNGGRLLAFTTEGGKYNFLWPIEIPGANDNSYLWRLEWDERPGIVNLYDGYQYNVIDMQKKEIIARKDIEKIEFGLNATIYEGQDELLWVRRYLKDHEREISINKICSGKYETIDFIRSAKYGDLFLFGLDGEFDHKASILIPNSKRNEVKIIEFTGLAESIYYSEFIERTGELHLFSDNNHYITAPLEKLF
jgi:hypothetical protein